MLAGNNLNTCAYANSQEKLPLSMFVILKRNLKLNKIRENYASSRQLGECTFIYLSGIFLPYILYLTSHGESWL